ncbi:hypothetical protein GCM10010174_63450 [Kutzneria viridogrisea]
MRVERGRDDPAGLRDLVEADALLTVDHHFHQAATSSLLHVEQLKVEPDRGHGVPDDRFELRGYLPARRAGHVLTPEVSVQAVSLCGRD